MELHCREGRVDTGAYRASVTRFVQYVDTHKGSDICDRVIPVKRPETDSPFRARDLRMFGRPRRKKRTSEAIVKERLISLCSVAHAGGDIFAQSHVSSKRVARAALRAVHLHAQPAPCVVMASWRCARSDPVQACLVYAPGGAASLGMK